MKPTPKSVDQVIDELEAQQLHPTRQLARKVVAQYRQTSGLTQAQIDSGSNSEERRQRFVASSLRFRRRGLLARLFR